MKCITTSCDLCERKVPHDTEWDLTDGPLGFLLDPKDPLEHLCATCYNELAKTLFDWTHLRRVDMKTDN